MQEGEEKHSKGGAGKQGLWGLVPVLMFLFLISRVYGITALFDAFSADPVDAWVIVGGVVSALFAVGAVYLLILFFNKSKKIPKYFTYYLFGLLSVSIVLGILSAIFSDTLSPLTDVAATSPTVVASVFVSVAISLVFYALFFVALIIAVKKSERVRLTFTR